MPSLSSADLIEGMHPGGKYDGVIGLLRHWNGFDRFDRPLVEALPPSVKFISSLGAGYDMIDIDACKEKGKLPRLAATSFPRLSNLFAYPRHRRVQHTRRGQ